MLGYTLATLVGLLLVAWCLGALGGARTRPADDERRERDEPSADEPTPDWSVTATPPEVDAARKHTPPA